MTVCAVFDAAGRRRLPATMSGYHAGRAPRNKGQLYPADPPTVEEIIAVMRQDPDDRLSARLRAVIVVLWRGGLRVQEALGLGEHDRDPRRDRCSCAAPKAAAKREIGMDAWGWQRCQRGSPHGSSGPWDRCSASSTARPEAGLVERRGPGGVLSARCASRCAAARRATSAAPLPRRRARA
jgi:hypothetical protein